MALKVPSAVVVVDTEFTTHPPGGRPVPVCAVGRDIRSGQEWRTFQGEFRPKPPWPTGPDVLFVAYYASAELGFYRALDWPMPERILDLFIEFRNLTNGRQLPSGAGLLGALAFFGLDHIGVVEKKEMQEAIGSGTWQGRFMPKEILDYCAQDMAALERLLPVMLPHIDMPRALLRGRYMAAAAAIEHNGTPIDVPTLEQLREHWTDIQDDLIASIDKDYGVYDGRTFKEDRFEQFLARNNIPWARLDSGRLSLGDDTFRQASKAYPNLAAA